MNSMKTTKTRQDDDDADLMVGRIRQRQRIRSGSLLSLRLCISAVLRWCLVLMVINDGVAAATASAPDGYDNAAPAIAAAAADVGSASLPQKRVGNEQRILSRKRRYLIFPEGSSLQLSKFRATCTNMYIISTILDTVSVCCDVFAIVQLCNWQGYGFMPFNPGIFLFRFIRGALRVLIKIVHKRFIYCAAGQSTTCTFRL